VETFSGTNKIDADMELMFTKSRNAATHGASHDPELGSSTTAQEVSERSR
jgi:hypothetical protein